MRTCPHGIPGKELCQQCLDEHHAHLRAVHWLPPLESVPTQTLNVPAMIREAIELGTWRDCSGEYVASLILDWLDSIPAPQPPETPR